MLKKILFVCLLRLMFFCPDLKAQTSKPDSLIKDSVLSNALRVFMDIGSCYYCDYSYIRKEINYVNYVRDPKESQVQVIIVETTTGSGGTEFNFVFIGKNEFLGMNDTIKQATSVNNTKDENRSEIVRVIKMGLMRYIMKTPSNKFIEIKSNLPVSGNENVQDKWKSWVFNLNLSAYGSGEKAYTSLYLWSSASAGKVTPVWKIKFKANSSYHEAKYVLDDTTIIRTYRRSYYFSQNTIKSLSKHWSVGCFYDASNSTYDNMAFSNNFSSGIEYDIFPYDKSSSKLITFRYKIGTEINQYFDTTIYNKMNETLLTHSIGLGMNFITKWGSLSASLDYGNYLKDFSLNRFNLNNYLNVRIFKGLSLSGSVYLSIIHDQIALAKGGSTLQEVLLQQHQLATQYSYNFDIGITYTFGSIYNNVVNPRFDY